MSEEHKERLEEVRRRMSATETIVQTLATDMAATQTMVKSLAAEVGSLAGDIKTLASSLAVNNKTNWPVLIGSGALVLSFVTTFGSFAFMTMNDDIVHGDHRTEQVAKNIRDHMSNGHPHRVIDMVERNKEDIQRLMEQKADRTEASDRWRKSEQEIYDQAIKSYIDAEIHKNILEHQKIGD